MVSLRFLRRKFSNELVPTTVTGWLAVYAGGLWLLLYALRSFVNPASPPFGTAFFFCTAIEFFALLILAFRWLRHRFMWRLRNRLAVTYVFIGVIPVVLLVAMVALAAYLFAGQFSAYVVTSDVQREMRRVQALNEACARHLALGIKEGRSLEKIAQDTDRGPAWMAAVQNGKVVVLQQGESTQNPTPPPDLRDRTGFVLDSEELFLRSVTTIPTERGDVTVISSLPLTKSRVEKIVGELGEISIYGKTRRKQPVDSQGVRMQVGEESFNLDTQPKLRAGAVPAGKNFADVGFLPPGSLLTAYDWQSGKPTTLFMTVKTRPSALYERFFQTNGEMTTAIIYGLAFVAIVFALIELLALFIGMRLSKTMTRSVAELYDATQRVNRGDFSRRIRVVSRDQLAALETSFNSMTESLQKLIAEQKEKQRIESELAIAQEVQALLFPRDITEIEALEVHGICKPARTVSGDYYDFLPVSGTRLGIAVGDISGKGISAALLMATVHAFVRAYTLVDKVPELAVAANVHQNVISHTVRTGDLNPGALMALLNQQMYESTPTEKYATMFLGFYDQTTRKFKYSNAGHLPPILISTDGSVRYLDGAGGTVVGLFGGMTYPDDSIEMRPGDIFVAYSDGVTEPENEFGEFSVERLAQLVKDHRKESLARITDIVITSVVDWIGEHEQPDDVTLVLARAR
jgi:sigma-B regulation protein RsbU (phosphoserine phosphatase)